LRNELNHIGELIASAIFVCDTFFVDAHLEIVERSAFQALVLAHARVSDRVEADLAGAGLPPLGWFEVLAAIEGSEAGAVRMFELAEAISMSRSGLTRLIDRLEHEGLIERRTCPSDRRGQFVVGTPAGAEVLGRMRPVCDAAVHEHLVRHLADPARLIAELGRVAAATSACPGTPSCE
jgi:DNA-binding MarR family transcriptional regulator